MNVIKLMGGLGNQFFQYAFGEAMMLKGIDVKFDKSWYSSARSKHRECPRPYVLNKYSICDCTQKGTFINHETIKENGIFNIDYLTKKDCNFEGYWQYYPYFKSILPILKKEFTLSEKIEDSLFLSLKNQIMEDSNSVSIHIRRGDYLKQTGWGILPNAYYLRALKSLQLTNKHNVYIFSDDIPYCQKLFNQRYFYSKLHFVDTGVVHWDFELMRLCKTNITANSTFSYWAAMLNDNTDKKVICPEYWLGEKEPDTNELHYPNEWIKI